jgi:hypothetical protein
MPPRKRPRSTREDHDADDDDSAEKDTMSSSRDDQKASLISNLRKAFQYKEGSLDVALEDGPDMSQLFPEVKRRHISTTQDENYPPDEIQEANLRGRQHQTSSSAVKGRKKVNDVQATSALSHQPDPRIDTAAAPELSGVHFDITPPSLPKVGPRSHWNYFYRLDQQVRQSTSWQLSALSTLASYWQHFRVTKTNSYFDRRVTVVEWHSDYERLPSVVALASKGGDIVWYDHEKNAKYRGYAPDKDEQQEEEDVPFLYGTGKGGSITAMKFHPELPNMIYTTSIDGTVACK